MSVPAGVAATSWLSYLNDCDFRFYRGAFGSNKILAQMLPPSAVCSQICYNRFEVNLPLMPMTICVIYTLEFKRHLKFFGLWITWWEAINWPAVVYEWPPSISSPYKSGWQGETALKLNQPLWNEPPWSRDHGVMPSNLSWFERFWSTWQARDSIIWILDESDSAK